MEMHHDMKKDAPSGTSMKVAEMMAECRENIPKDRTEKITVEGSRGGRYQNIPIHSIRLPGYVAHLKTIFGAAGETLTLSHDSIHRESFMPGVLMSCRKVMDLKELVYGLEYFLKG